MSEKDAGAEGHDSRHKGKRYLNTVVARKVSESSWGSTSIHLLQLVADRRLEFARRNRADKTVHPLFSPWIKKLPAPAR